MKTILQRFGALVCMFRGHLRGKRVVIDGLKTGLVQCPRCGKTWLRKVRARGEKKWT